MSSRWHERGSAMLVSLIAVLVVAVAGVAVIRFASREVAGANAGRRETAMNACAEAARAYLMSGWKLLGDHDVGMAPVKVTLESVTPTVLVGGHYGEDPTAAWSSVNHVWISQNVQVVPLNPMTLGAAYQAGDLTNRIVGQVIPYRVMIRCRQGTPPDVREVELEYGVQYGL